VLSDHKDVALSRLVMRYRNANAHGSVADCMRTWKGIAYATSREKQQLVDISLLGATQHESPQNINSRLKGAVDRELGGNIVRLKTNKNQNARILTLMRTNYFYSAFFEDPSCAKCSK